MRYLLISVIVCAAYFIGVSQQPNKCPFEGAECPNVQSYLQDYQIQVYNDTVTVYDANRIVGKYINTKWDSQLDSIIIGDNE